MRPQVAPYTRASRDLRIGTVVGSTAAVPLLRRPHGHHRDPSACRSSARAAFIVCLYRHVSVATPRNELQATVEAAVLRPSGGRAPASAISSFTVQITIRSASPSSSHHVNRALSGDRSTRRRYPATLCSRCANCTRISESSNPHRVRCRRGFVLGRFRTPAHAQTSDL
jgi:hypothetical protein